MNRRASEDGTPTLLAIYDATPFQLYSDDVDVLQALFGPLSIAVWEDDTRDTTLRALLRWQPRADADHE